MGSSQLKGSTQVDRNAYDEPEIVVLGGSKKLIYDCELDPEIDDDEEEKSEDINEIEMQFGAKDSLDFS